MKITDEKGADRSGMVTLKTYFGFHPGQTLSEFNAEVKALSPEAKTELVTGAALALGWTVA